MEIIERYIYAVTQRLPQNQREEVAKDLRGLIEDMLEIRVEDRISTEEDIEQVLVELGNPHDLAVKYGGEKRYLISPKLFHPYISILKIVIVAIAIAMSVVFIIETIIEPSLVLKHFVHFIGTFLSASAQAFAWITVGFSIAEYRGKVPKDLIKEGENRWKPSDLPPIPDRSKQIKRGEAITGIIFSVIGLVFIIFSNHLFGVPIFADDKLVAIVPFLNNEFFANYLPFIYALVAVGIIKECLKLIIGKWTKSLAIYNLILNGVTFGLAIILLRDQLIWNPNFMQELSQLGGLNPQTEPYNILNEIWVKSKIWILPLFFIALAIDTISVFFKALKHGDSSVAS